MPKVKSITMSDLSDSARAYLEHPSFQEMFCGSCDDGNNIIVGGETCHCDFEMDNPSCWKAARYEEILEALQEADTILNG